jgi:hypothetical protein
MEDMKIDTARSSWLSYRKKSDRHQKFLTVFFEHGCFSISIWWYRLRGIERKDEASRQSLYYV